MAEVDGDDNKKRRRSFWSRVWNGLFLFRLHGDDFEKRLQYISKEEATLISKMKRRSSSWRSTARNLVVVSVFLEVLLTSPLHANFCYFLQALLVFMLISFLYRL